MFTKQIGNRTETFQTYHQYVMALEAQAAVESRREAGRGYITEEVDFRSHTGEITQTLTETETKKENAQD